MRRDAARRRRLVRPAHLQRARPDLRDRARGRRRAPLAAVCLWIVLDSESFTRRLARRTPPPRVVRRQRPRPALARTRDPYAILVSEVMLQQTQVARVVPRYREWLERWPTVEALAAASPADVIRAWQGLGYNRRALNLHRAARVVAERGWPDDLTELPGVGPYTAAAIGNFAFGRAGAAGGRQRRGACSSAPARRVRAGGGAGALRPRRDGLPRARTALRRCPLAGDCPSRGRTYEPSRKQGPFEGSFRQRRARAAALVAAGAAAGRRPTPRPSRRCTATASSRSTRARLASVLARRLLSAARRRLDSRRDRYDELIAALREAAQPDRPAPPDFATYLEKVRTRRVQGHRRGRRGAEGRRATPRTRSSSRPSRRRSPPGSSGSRPA